MTSRKRTQAHIEADKRYRQRRKIVRVAFHEENDVELLKKLRSQVKDDTELPALIKQIVESHFN